MTHEQLKVEILDDVTTKRINLEALAWGMSAIWLGVTAYLAQIALLPAHHWFAYFLAGWGVIIIGRWLIDYAKKRHLDLGSTIFGGFALAIGLGFILNLSGSIIWPAAAIAIGAILIALAFRKRGAKASFSNMVSNEEEQQTKSRSSIELFQFNLGRLNR
jgi:hypothetical protein